MTTAVNLANVATGPAFSAFRNTDQTGVTSATFTKVQLNQEDFDTANCFDSTTNYRFTPNVAGYYQINGNLFLTGTNISAASTQLWKNGSAYKYGSYSLNAVGSVVSVVSELVYLNGTTDYIELYGAATVTSGTVTFNSVSSSSLIRFSGFLARAA